MILAAYYVETATPVFAPCFWPATSLKSALRVARKLSENVHDKRYPNAFAVVGSDDKAICKFFRGQRYTHDETI